MFSKSKARTWTWTWSFGFQIIEWHAHVKKEYIKHEVSNLMFNKVSCYFSLCSFHFEKWSTYKKLQKRSLTMNIKKVLAESMQLDFLMFIRVIAIKWRIIKRNIWGINNSPLKVWYDASFFPVLSSVERMNNTFNNQILTEKLRKLDNSQHSIESMPLKTFPFANVKFSLYFFNWCLYRKNLKLAHHWPYITYKYV